MKMKTEKSVRLKSLLNKNISFKDFEEILKYSTKNIKSSE